MSHASALSITNSTASLLFATLNQTALPPLRMNHQPHKIISVKYKINNPRSTHKLIALLHRSSLGEKRPKLVSPDLYPWR
ncbi:MAG: hypothetical protein GXP08_06140 [Gammaproteobacteria bacterium]|nr:hypothetical protein [Gammaproteobacteria bacterium]